MRLTVNEIAALVGGKLEGDGSAVVSRVAGLASAGPGDVTFARREHLKEARESRATAALVPEPVPGMRAAQVIVDNPYYAFIILLRLAEKELRYPPRGIHPTAALGESVLVGEGAAIGAHVTLGDYCVLEHGAIIYPNVSIGAHCVIGAESVIYSNVSIREHVSIGKRTIIHSGTSIGGDGFGYIQQGGVHVKVPQVGTVEIGDDVEIGCNCTIDRATVDKTVIGNGVKIDNHSHIAHNCRIGDNSMLIAYARMGGSTVLGKNVLLAEDVGLTNGITLGDGCIVGAASKVIRSWPAGSVVLGWPAQKMADEKRQIALIHRLPRLFETVKALKAKLG